MDLLFSAQAQGRSTGKTGTSAAGGTDEDGSPRKVTGTTKARMEASRKDKHR